MKGNQLARILRFAQATQDKVIVTDTEGREPMVVMPFDMYEHLIDVGRAAAGFDTDGQKAPEPADLALSTPTPPLSSPPLGGGENTPETDTPVPQKPEGFLGEEEQFYLEPVE